MAEAPQELAIVQKAYDLLIWTHGRVAQFPRQERFSLGERLERQVAGILEDLLRAKYTRDRTPILRAVNMELEVLRFQFRAARDLQCIPKDSSEHAARSVNEIGQMVGGWMKYGGNSSH